MHCGTSSLMLSPAVLGIDESLRMACSMLRVTSVVSHAVCTLCKTALVVIPAEAGI